jgi:S-adenosylmethionine-diacylgycerolhomoserine-N-methlytransferase
MITAPASTESSALAARMDNLYRRQRHIYDFTRKYFLLGRDRLIARLQPKAGDSVLEIGCGTGRNLVRAARRYPHARFFGIDISAQMLISAGEAIARNRLTSRVVLARADAANFDAATLLGRTRFDRVYFSYSLSMIPQWRAALPQAYALLERRGTLHIVDFGGRYGLPAPIPAALARWLQPFAVTPCDELEYELFGLAERANAALAFERPYLGYAQCAILQRAD